MQLALNDLPGAALTIDAWERSFQLRRIDGSPCTNACPAGVNVKAYVSLIANGRYPEALQVVRERCPLPGVCGRVCDHPCETACRREDTDAPIAIRALKRFVADAAADVPPPPLPERATRGERVAVVGSGPGGLTCAYNLARRGFPVTLIEAESELGGMLRQGIPEYRLPRDILDREIGYMLGPTIDVRTGIRLGHDLGLEDLFGGGHKAVFLGVGATKSRALGLDGEAEVKGFLDALAFLKGINEGSRACPGKRVLVVGGGNTAIDAARTALRLGAEHVELVYRRSRHEMPAGEEEVRAAEEEGITMRFLTAPGRLEIADGRLRGLECMAMRLGEPDSSGRARPIPIDGSEFMIDADVIIPAIGQQPHLPFLGHRSAHAVSSAGRLRADSEFQMTEVKGVFAGGDAVTGPATVIEAIAAGARAAAAIEQYIELGSARFGQKQAPGTGEPRWELGIAGVEVDREERRNPPERPAASRRDFDEVESAYSTKDAIAEASRCLRCGPCSECHSCVSSCRHRHVVVRGTGALDGGASLPVAELTLRVPEPGLHDELETKPMRATLARSEGARPFAAPLQVWPLRAEVDAKLCRGCGECVEVCSFDAPTLEPTASGEYVSRVDPLRCRGCGSCVGVCSTGAISVEAFSRAWVREQLHKAVATDRGRIVIACERHTEETALGDDVAPDVRLPCVGQLDAGLILELIDGGAERVVVAGCKAGHCRFQGGAELAQRRVDIARQLLELTGQDPDCVQGVWSGDDEPEAIESRLAATHGVE